MDELSQAGFDDLLRKPALLPSCIVSLALLEQLLADVELAEVAIFDSTGAFDLKEKNAIAITLCRQLIVGLERAIGREADDATAE